MKRSSLLHNPKDMLSRSFKPAKCKMSLKLAASRLKLLKNKKEVQVKQMKRELAQLLDSGQNQTARIRVEHVIREEKMMAAYDLIEIYCELIVARLPIIESQKNCPIDMKEAITSVIFASPRCGDIPELMDIQKHLTAKYGKEFASAAIDLRPDCGVSRMLVDKLSAKAPDGQAKIKVLTAIAEEHHIKWDPKAFGDSETVPNDLLNGPSTFDNANKMHAESPYSVPDIQAPPSHQVLYNQSFSSSEQNVRSSHATQTLPTQLSGVSNVASPVSQAEQRHSGTRADRAEIKQEFHGEGNAFSFGQQSWNMDFKDATSAAQAAAESAELASMAARAAAELSRGRIARQHSTESFESDIHVHRDAGTRKYLTSKITNDYHPKDSANVSIAEPHPRVLNDQNAKSERSYQDDHGSDIRAAHRFSFDEDPFVHNVQRAEEYSKKSLSKEEQMRAEMEMRSDKSDVECGDHKHENFSSEKFGYYGKKRNKKQSNSISSGSHSSVSGDDDKTLNSSNIMLGPDIGDDHSAGFEGHMQEDSLRSDSHDTAAGAIFDESGSDGEEFGFNMGSHHEKLYVPSPDRNLTEHFSRVTGAGSLFETRKSEDRSQTEFSTKRNSFQESSGGAEATIDRSQPDDFGPATFDDSDDQSSDGTDMGHSWLRGTKDSGDFYSKENQSLGSTRSSFDERHRKNDQIMNNSVGSPQNFGSDRARTSRSSPGWGKSRLESNDTDGEPPYHNSVNDMSRDDSSQSRSSLLREVNDDVNSSHSHGSEMDDENLGRELNFGKLTGGFRHKGNTCLPYVKHQSDNVSSSSQKGDEESPIVIPQSKASPAVQSSGSGVNEVFGNARRSRVPNSHYDSDSDSSEEEFERQPTSRAQEPYAWSTGKDVKAKPNLRGPVTYFHSESSDSEDDSTEQVSTSRNRFGTGVSRRTKASSSSGSISHLKGHPSSVVLEKSDSVVGRNPMTISHSAETPQPSQSQKKHSGHMKPSSSEKVGSRTTMESKISSPEKSRDSHGTEQPLNKKQTPEASGSFQTQKISSRNSINNRKDSGKKASHVRQKEKPEADKAESQKTGSENSIIREDNGKKASQVQRKEKPEADKAESQKTGSVKSINREDSGKKASHVHPKLPDYDTLAARIQALRTNRE